MVLRIPPLCGSGPLEISLDDPLRVGGTDECAPSAESGIHEIATCDLIWRRVMRMPPSFGHGPLELYPLASYIKEGRTEGPAPAVAFGRKEIATCDGVWKRVLRIPP